MTDSNHPYFKVIISSTNSQASMPFARPILSVQGRSENLLIDQFGKPFFVLMQNETNKYLFTAPLDEKYTNLMNHAIFLPLMYRMCEWSVAMDRPLFIRSTAAQVSLKIEDLDVSKHIRVAGNGVEFVPTTSYQSNYLTVSLPPSQLSAGFYAVVSENDTVGEFSVNYTSEESIFDFYSEEELTEYAESNPNIEVLILKSQYPMLAGGMNAELPASLWKIALFVALLFLLVESLLVRYL
jgi:hypothetical protein